MKQHIKRLISKRREALAGGAAPRPRLAPRRLRLPRFNGPGESFLLWLIMSRKQKQLEVAQLLADAARRDCAHAGFNPVLYARLHCETCLGSGLYGLHVCACVWHSCCLAAQRIYQQIRGDERLHRFELGPSLFDWVIDYQQMAESLSSRATPAIFGRELVRRSIFPLAAYLGRG